jgi:hypothetical protein
MQACLADGIRHGEVHVRMRIDEPEFSHHHAPFHRLAGIEGGVRVVGADNACPCREDNSATGQRDGAA